MRKGHNGMEELKRKGPTELARVHKRVFENILKNVDKTHEHRLVSIPKADLESLEATIETLENKYVMEQLEKSEVDIREGRVRNIDKFIKELKTDK